MKSGGESVFFSSQAVFHEIILVFVLKSRDHPEKNKNVGEWILSGCSLRGKIHRILAAKSGEGCYPAYPWKVATLLRPSVIKMCAFFLHPGLKKTGRPATPANVLRHPRLNEHFL